MAFDPITGLMDLVRTGLDKFVGDKMSEAEKAQVAMETARLAMQQDQGFRDFMLQYEGAAKDAPYPVRLLRSMIRPVITLGVGYVDCLYFTDAPSLNLSEDHHRILWLINLIVLGFWFGDRAVQRAGLDKVLMRWAENKGPSKPWRNPDTGKLWDDSK